MPLGECVKDRRFVFVLPGDDRRKGGAKVIVDHARGLRALGARASVLVPEGEAPGAHWDLEVEWTKKLPVADASETVLVIPELMKPASIRSLRESGFRIVLLAQSWIFLSNCFGERPAEMRAMLDGVICTSEHIAGFLARNFGIADALRVPVIISMPDPAADAVARSGIACMPAKRSFEAKLIEYLFRIRFPELASVRWTMIDGVRHRQALEHLREAEYFLALPRFEGFGLPPLEAMAAGCVVVGFTGSGVRDYATAENGFWLPEDDVEGIVEKLGAAVRAGLDDPSAHASMVAAARETAGRFDERRFMEALAAAYGEVAAGVRRIVGR